MCDSLSRRTFVGGAGLMSFGGAWAFETAARAASSTPTKFTADKVLQDLLDGNERFASGKTTSPRRSPKDFSAVAEAHSVKNLAKSRVLRPIDRIVSAAGK